MSASVLILNARLVNECRITDTDVLIENGRIARLGGDLSGLPAGRVIDAAGQYLLPGLIDDQVHFREPGLTHKATIASEARAAVAGGVTSFMEMPNTVPNTLTQALLQEKYDRAARTSPANYSFYMGASNDNLEEVLRTDFRQVCGVKAFMGSSTGNMLVDDPATLERLFSQVPGLIAVHCEDEATIRRQAEALRTTHGEHPPAGIHPLVRPEAACLRSSSFAVELARRHGTRLHVLHISTADETTLFEPAPWLGNPAFLQKHPEKRITAEACVHHLWFSAADYDRLGNRIKCNPAIKADGHRQRILQAVLDDRIDVIATDHAPHTLAEKQQPYWQAPSGLPLVQHALPMLLDLHAAGHLTLEAIARKTAHAVADCFGITERGYVREGYWADLVLVDLARPQQVSPENILYQCGWSPLEGHCFGSRITHTWVSGQLAWADGVFDEGVRGRRLAFKGI